MSTESVVSGIYLGAGSVAQASEELFKVVPEPTLVHLALTLLAGFIVFFGLFSGFVKEKLYVGEAIVATVFGIVFSQYAAGLFAPRTWSSGHHFDEITLELTRAIIALSVFAVGVELPKAYVLRHWRSLSVLLGPVMLFGWMISGALMYGIIPGLEFLPALVVAAGVTPTDPILASSVVGKGKFAQEHVPAHLRHLLQAESGSNDGAAFPFLYLALFLLLREEHSVGQAIGYWFVLVVLYQIVLGIVIGVAVGIAARKLLKFSKRRKLIDRESMVAMYIALALFVTGLTTLAGSDDLLAAFAAGSAFAWDDWFTESIEDSNFSSTIDLLANCTVFIYVGATMPFSAWSDATLTLTPWRLIVLAISILALRRLPTILATWYWIPDIKTRREAIFAGHFGPMGVGAIFISTLAATKLPTPNVPPETSLDILALTIQPITYFIVLSSILIHGLTITFFSLGRRVHSRVQSISRTFTQASQMGDEPSWMSRVKRVRTGDDIVVNRDEEDSAEKGAGVGAILFGSSSGSGTANGSKEGSVKEEEEVKKVGEEKEREDEHPVENVCGDEKEDRDSHVDEEETGKGVAVPDTIEEAKEPDSEQVEKEDVKEEAKYCAGDNVEQAWMEGQQVVIERNDGESVQVIDLAPSPSATRAATLNPQQEVVEMPRGLVEEEKARQDAGEPESGAVARFMKRRGSIVATTLKLSDGLTPEQREARRKDKMLRDAWCRKEKHYPEEAETGMRTPSGRVREGREWTSGSKVVIERGDDDIEVRDLTPEEKAARAARHLKALKALGQPVSAIEAELAKLVHSSARNSTELDRSKGKGKEVAPTVDAPSTTAEPSASTSAPTPGTDRGLSLTRTTRVEADDDGEWENESSAPYVRPTLPSGRPAPPPRANSRVRAMRQMLFRRTSKSPERERGRVAAPTSADGSRSSSPSRSIRFAERDRPARDPNSVTTGGAFPVVGSGLSIRRVPTVPMNERDIRFSDSEPRVA